MKGTCGGRAPACRTRSGFRATGAGHSGQGQGQDDGGPERGPDEPSVSHRRDSNTHPSRGPPDHHGRPKNRIQSNELDRGTAFTLAVDSVILRFLGIFVDFKNGIGLAY